MRMLISAIAFALALHGCSEDPGSRRDRLPGEGGSGGDQHPPPTPIALKRVAAGFPWLTDFAFLPGDEGVLIVADNPGRAHWVRLDDGSTGTFLTIEGIDETREGLLGIAFHPRFPADPRIFVHYALAGEAPAPDLVRISSFELQPGDPIGPATAELVLLELEAPLPNHNGGQVAFGKDGYLWASFGDGGTVEAPRATSQAPDTLWGKLVRIDVDGRDGAKPYAIPADNPFVADPSILPEIWALGLRNPWRFSFDEEGLPIVADVGADHWEEISVVHAGENHGWNAMEGGDCFPAESSCDPGSYSLPSHAYRHDGVNDFSITGGFLYLGQRIPSLHGRYLFADFEQGTISSIELRTEVESILHLESERMFVAFARDAAGELHIGDFASGEIFRLDPAD